MMSPTSDEDPFLQVQADVLSALTTTRPLFTSYLRIRSLSPPSALPSPELLSAHADLVASLRGLEDDLEDLRASISAIEEDPNTYGLAREEVARRRKLVDDVGRECGGMRQELNGRAVAEENKGKGRDGPRNPPYDSRPIDDDDNRPEDDDANPDYDTQFQQQQQKRLWAEQDTMLDSVGLTIGTLRSQAGAMGRELEEQAEMLEEVETVADRVGGRLKGGLKSVGEVVRRGEDRWSGICVWLRIGLLCLLLVLVLVL